MMTEIDMLVAFIYDKRYDLIVNYTCTSHSINKTHVLVSKWICIFLVRKQFSKCECMHVTG
jgi:hypothetical protein